MQSPLESHVERVLVAVAPPTPNGDLHLGHLSGPYLGTDVYARYLRQLGKQVYFVTGSDDHQSYVPVKGVKTGKTPVEVVEHYGRTIPNTLRKAGIEVDTFLRPYHTPAYQAFVQSFFHRLVENGSMEKRRGPALYCDTCQLYLYEAHVGGNCPSCGEGANGNGCEKCGFVNDCVDLANARCNHCQGRPVTKEYERFYFPLSRHAGMLKDYFLLVSMNGHLQALTQKMLKDGYPDISATHVADWGIPVNLPGFEGQVIYEWVEMAAGYLYMAKELTGSWETFFKDPRSMFVLGYGFDNAFFYTSLVPALLHAYDPEIRLPRAFLSNEFYQLQGLKFSTSRNHAIWGDELLAEFSADAMRYYLSRTRPEVEQTSFEMDEFRAGIRHHLREAWESWIERLKKKGYSEKAEGEGKPAAREIFEVRVRELHRLINECYRAETFSLRSAVRLLDQLVFEADEYGKQWEFLRGTPSWLPLIGGEVFALRTLAEASAPLMPNFSKSVFDSTWTFGALTKGIE